MTTYNSSSYSRTAIGMWHGVMPVAGTTGNGPSNVIWLSGSDGEYSDSALLIALRTVKSSLSEPGVPGLIEAPAEVFSEYLVKWGGAAGNVDTYELFENDVSVHQGSEREVIIDAHPIGSYRYSVRACNANGCSVRTPDRVVTVVPVMRIFYCYDPIGNIKRIVAGYTVPCD